MTRTRFRPSLRLLIAMAVWASIVATTFVCAQFSERLTSADVQRLIWSRQQYQGQQQVDAWAKASSKTIAGFVKAMDPGPDEYGKPVPADQLEPLWIWELPASLQSVDFDQLGDPVWTRGPRPANCGGTASYDGSTLGAGPDPFVMGGCSGDTSGGTAVAMSTIPTGTGKVLVVAQTIDVSYERFPLQYQRAETRRLAVLVGLVGALAAWLLAGAVTRPIERLRVIVDRFGDGDLTARAAMDGPSEVAGLANGFNTMADRVEHTLDVQRRFVADTSHELRTPAAAMLAATQALDLDGPHDEALDLLVPQAERLATLTDDLLVLNRFDEGRQRLDARPVDLADVVREAVATVAAGRDVRVEGTLPGEVVVDPARVMVVVRNLVANALQHGAEPVVVSIDEGHEPAPLVTSHAVMEPVTGRDMVQVRVSDAGPGVPETLRDSVFDRFVRGDDARHGGGRGLGLSLARENARLHGGDLALADDGRTFVASFPVHPVPEPNLLVPEPHTLVPEPVEGISARRNTWFGRTTRDALPLALCEGLALLAGLLVDSGELYLANDSHFFHRPTWQWLPLLAACWAVAAVLPVMLEAGVRRVLRGRVGRVLGPVLAAALLVAAAVATLFLELGERPLTAALALGGIGWLCWRGLSALVRRRRRRR